MLVIGIYIILLSLLFVGIKNNKEKNNFMRQNNTDALKGVFCIIVVLSHLNDCSPYLYIIQLVFICVFCFFMFSGYGLTISFLNCDYFNRKSWFHTQLKRSAKLLAILGVTCCVEWKLGLTLLSGGGQMDLRNICSVFVLWTFSSSN